MLTTSKARLTNNLLFVFNLFNSSLLLLVDTTTIVQAVAPLIEPMQTQIVELLARTAPKRIQCIENASSIHSEARKRHFNCYQLDRDAFTNNYLKSYRDQSKSNFIRRELVRYLVVIRRHLLKNNKDEKRFVQPSMNQLLTRIKCVLNCRSVIIDERHYELVLENKEFVTKITGLADHTIKLESCDSHIITVEDKAIGKAFTNEHKAQIQSHMTHELKELRNLDNYSPDEYNGILQNGSKWLIFLRRRVGKKFLWNYVELPDALSEGNIINEHTKLLAQYIEHCLYVAEQAAFAILNPSNRIVVTSLQSIPEDSTQDEDGYGGSDDENDQQNKDMHLEDVDDAQEGEQSQHHSYENGKFSSSVKSSVEESNKENVAFLPLRSAFVNQLPALYCRPFL